MKDFPQKVLRLKQKIEKNIEEEHFTEWGNAKRLVKLHGENIHFCASWGKWLIWNGKFWEVDLIGDIVSKAKSVISAMFVRLSEDNSLNNRDSFGRFALNSEQYKQIKAMIMLAQSEPGISITVDQLNKGSFLLNCLNGTLDLKTNRFYPHRREDLITRIAPITYDPEAKCPTWDAFMYRVMEGNKNLISYLQRFAGYFLTDEISEQVLLICYGRGANGKSTFLTILQEILGNDYAKQAAPDILIKKFDVHPTGIADLHGARLVVASETEHGSHFAESQLKQLTGGDFIKTRRMREDYWQFKPTHKIVLSANYFPIIKGLDEGIWRRICLVFFQVIIPPEERDIELKTKLLSEKSGILNWMIQGFNEWKEKGLAHPEEVKEALRIYRNEMNVVGEFLEKYCIIDPKSQIPSSLLYSEFSKWHSESKDEVSISQKEFGTKLKEMGFKKTKKGIIFWEGIALKTSQSLE